MKETLKSAVKHPSRRKHQPTSKHYKINICKNTKIYIQKVNKKLLKNIKIFNLKSATEDVSSDIKRETIPFMVNFTGFSASFVVG